MGTLEDRENNNDKWIRVTGSRKTKKLLNPKPKPKLHNAFAILSQPNAPTYYGASCPTLQIDDNKTIIPPGPQEHRRQQIFARLQHIKQTLQQLSKSDDLFLATASPTLRTNAPPSPRTTPTMQCVWQSIPPMHNAINQPLGLPNAAAIPPTAWVLDSIEP
jgi:hypothetical protein